MSSRISEHPLDRKWENIIFLAPIKDNFFDNISSISPNIIGVKFLVFSIKISKLIFCRFKKNPWRVDCLLAAFWLFLIIFIYYYVIYFYRLSVSHYTKKVLRLFSTINLFLILTNSL